MNPIDTATNKALKILKDKSRKLRIIPEFARNTLLQKWAIVVCLGLILSLLLSPRIHFSRPDYKVGMIAIHDVKADRDFLVEDRVSTEQKKMEILADVKTVYDYDSDLQTQTETNLNKAFLAIEESYLRFKNENESENLSDAAKQRTLMQARRDFEKSLGIPLTNDEFEILHRYHFSSSIAKKISKLMGSVIRSAWITNVTFLKQDLEKGIIIRDLKTLSEKEMKNLASIRHMNHMEVLLLRKANQLMRYDRADIRKVGISLAKKMIQPNLTFNKSATDLKKQTVLAGVKPVYYQVQTNEMIIREGEKIHRDDLNKLEAFYRIRGEQKFSDIYNFLGMFLTILFLAILLYLLSRNWLKKSRNVNIDILFLSVSAILQVLLVKSGIFISEAINRTFPFIPVEACFFTIPFAVSAMVVGVMINRNMAFIFSIFSSVLISFLFENKVTITLFSFLGSMTACYHIVHCRKRSAFFKAGFFLGLINIVVIISLSMLAGNITFLDSLIKMAMGFFGGIQTGIIVAGITPLFETLFKYTTEIKLLELANLNQPIFQRMIIEAPGTYHHSIVVGSMVETAAEAIGANSLLVKVSAYYHDIGKVKKPNYFIENQSNGENKHDKLSPRMSALVIISHIKDGCELAKEAKLGTEIVNIIREHHGNSLVRYFYDKAKKDDDASIRALPESDFRYPGPKPQTREAGLVLLGDVIEASSRILSNPTPSRIRNLVKERIEGVFMDGQLDECELTLRDLNSISETFTRILTGIFHQRIDYPMPHVREINVKPIHYYETAYRKQAEKSKA